MRSEKILGVLGMSFSEWREVKLGEIINLNYGKGLSATKRNPGNIPVYSSAGITGWHDKALIKKNGIVVGRKGTVGTVYYSETPFYCIDTAYYLTEDDTKEDLKYLYYLLNHLPLKKLNTDSAVPGLNRDNAYSQVFSLPPIQEQKSIAHILSTLDDKIEVNSQINRTLENIGQAIFKQWFVDFEFPNEDGESYKSSGGEMFESELGMIPKGWEVKKSSDIANVNIGKTPPRKEKECFTLDPDDYKWISIKDLGNSGAYIFDSSEYLTKESIEKYNVKVVPDNTVVLSFKLTIGRVSITCGQMTTNEAIAHFNLSNKSKITTEYLYLYLKGFDYGKLGNTSSIANAVNSKIIKSMPIIVPDNKTIKTFSEVMESVFSKIKYTIKQSDKLIEIRDSLLPKLMSGEIRVPLDEEGIVS